MRIKFIIYSLLTFLNSTFCESTFEVACEYELRNLSPFAKSVNTCNIVNDIVLKERYVTKGTVTGNFDKDKTYTDVTAIYTYFKTIHYLPDFTGIFGNLVALDLDMVKLLKISKDELKPYTKLRHLNLHANKLRILEKDLFMYNPHLGFIRLSHNMIKEIDPQVFDNLKLLSFLYLKGNECSQADSENPTAIAKVIKTFQDKCVIKYRPAPISRPREEHKRAVKQKTSIWKTFGITFGTVGGLLIGVGILYLIRKVFLQ